MQHKKWTNEEINYLKKNYPSKSATEIAKELNRSELSVNAQLYRLNLFASKRPREHNSNDTLCWDCDNAYALKCDWITFGKEVWDKAKKRKYIAANGEEMELVQVIECKHFAPDRRLRGGKANEG
jgi:hypothetical protein